VWRGALSATAILCSSVRSTRISGFLGDRGGAQSNGFIPDARGCLQTQGRKARYEPY
jgi:hypothetical protein